MKKLVAMFISTAFAAVAATDIHVSPKGDDSADGSFERPFATVARARDAVRTLKKSGAFPKGGVNVWLRNNVFTRCRYGITVSPWSQDHWRKFLSGARKP